MENKVKQREVIFDNNKIKSSRLFGQNTELTIIDNDAECKLRLTKSDKLILTK
jgi:hemin uptake protein HemP